MRVKRIQNDTDKLRQQYYEFDLDSKPIGQGGMGVVYRGTKVDERSGIRTEVAIKVLHDGLPDEVYARAEREASIQIKHINLVEMYGLVTEYERDKFGRQITHHYLISEMLHGLDLSDLLSGKFDNVDGSENEYAKKLFNEYIHNREKTAVNIIRNIASGVLALHDRGFIHRDIDPSNIMVTDDGCIKLIDFGIAKNLNTLSTNDRLTTTAGKFIGKAEYASPELVLGDVKSQNYTTDIYALGILLYRLLVGRLPFEGSQYDILQAQQNSKVPVRNIESPALAHVVKKATAKNQKERYETTAEFRVAIDAAIKRPGKRISKSMIVAGAAMVVAFIGVLLYNIIGPLKTDMDDQIISQNSVEDRFDNALSLLNSNNKEAVAEGFALMKELATENHEKAKIEIGLTYNPYPASKNQDTRSKEILGRRELLGLTDNMNNEADSVIKYLSSLENLPPEALYVLGFSQYKTMEDVDKAKYTALPRFKQAKDMLDKNVEVGHGYDAEELSQRLSSYIKALTNAE